MARLTAPPFGFDRERGPAALAERAGLPLVQRLPRLETEPRIVEPGRSPAWLLALVAMSYAAVLWLTAHVVLDRRPQELLLAATALVAAGALVGWRVRSRRARGRVLFRARPSTPVPRRFAAGATVTTVAGALSVTNGSRSRWLVPLPGDDLGPVALRPGRLGDQRQGAVKRLALVAADGHVLLHLGRSEWCGDGSEAQLAAAIGVPWDPTPVKGLDMTGDRGVSPCRCGRAGPPAAAGAGPRRLVGDAVVALGRRRPAALADDGRGSGGHLRRPGRLLRAAGARAVGPT